MLTSDQEAQVRFAYRVYSTGNTYGASQAVTSAAWELIDKIDVKHLGTPASFKRAAAEILSSAS